jgi:hypothetical protein
MRALADSLRAAATIPRAKLSLKFTRSITQIGIPPNARGGSVSDYATYVCHEHERENDLDLKVSRHPARALRNGPPMKKRERGPRQNKEDLLDTDLPPIRTEVENPPAVWEAAPTACAVVICFASCIGSSRVLELSTNRKSAPSDCRMGPQSHLTWTVITWTKVKFSESDRPVG